jgi:hypothetical protein
MNKHRRIKITKWAGACAAAAAGTFGYVGSAEAIWCNAGFNDYNALAAANESYTFLFAPYYNQQCGSYTVTVAENPAGEISNHFHLMYENACVSCFATNDFGLDRACAGMGTGCMAIDNSAYWRYAASMSHGQMITTTVSPNPGQWCVTTLLGTVSCVPTVGKPFRPTSVVIRGGTGLGNVDLMVTRLTTVQWGQPAKINTVVTLAAGNIYNLNFGLIDQLTVTGVAGGTQNFAYDNLIIVVSPG